MIKLSFLSHIFHRDKELQLNISINVIQDLIHRIFE